MNIFCSLQQAICKKIRVNNSITIHISRLLFKNIVIFCIIACILINIKPIKFFNIGVKKLIISYDPQITKVLINLINFIISTIINRWLSIRVGISEAIRLLLENFNLFIISSNLISYIWYKNIMQQSKFYSTSSSNSFNEWLAGLIDGDGCFQLSKKGYASLEIVMELRDKNCLYQIKDKFGGSVKLRAGNNHLRYRLHHKDGLLKIIYAVNGLIRNPIRLFQLNKICYKYNINLIQPNSLNYNNG